MKDFDTGTEERIKRRFEQKQFRHCHDNHQNSRIWTGAFLLLIGSAALLRYTLPVPSWVFSWQMLLITLGLFIGVRSRFRSGPGFVLMLIGGVFLSTEFFPDVIDRRMIWPIILMALGLFLIIKPKRYQPPFDEGASVAPQQPDAPAHQEENMGSNEDELDCTTIFGGNKKNIFSKNFRGGDVVNILGGTELNLSQADIQGTVVLEVTQIFGGTKIIVPPHWLVKPEMAAIFAGIEDKRHLQPSVIDNKKILLLKGTTVFGGIEVKSF